MNYLEQFSSERALMGEVSGFIEHVKPLKIKLNGDLLVIGPAPDLIDLVVVEPQLSSITSITVVDAEFNAERDHFLSKFQQCHPDIFPAMTQCFFFQDLSKTYESIIFLGAGLNFFKYDFYQDIPDRLNPGGKFFGTCNLAKPASINTLGTDSTIQIIDDIPQHPRWNGSWCGIIIAKE